VRAIAVAVSVPCLGPLTYDVPDRFPMPPVGARVLVPLGPRVVTGIVLPGVRPGSDRGQTGVRPGSTRGQTGVRPGSDRGQTGVKPGLTPV
jgi:hypothetical protein